jgi:transcriptional regulator with XRE-family HTH domain
MSVSELARQAGISKATLSVLEAGQGNPTIETIAALAVGLRLPLGDLIQPAELREPVVRRGTPAPADSKQELLHRIGSGTHTEVWRVRIGADGHRIESPAHTRGTVEHILVERGPMLVGDATAPELLEAGDFIIFPADVPHIYAASAADVEAVVIMSYPATV